MSSRSRPAFESPLAHTFYGFVPCICLVSSQLFCLFCIFYIFVGRKRRFVSFNQSQICQQPSPPAGGHNGHLYITNPRRKEKWRRRVEVTFGVTKSSVQIAFSTPSCPALSLRVPYLTFYLRFKCPAMLFVHSQRHSSPTGNLTYIATGPCGRLSIVSRYLETTNRDTMGRFHGEKSCALTRDRCVNALSWSDDGQTLLSGSDDRRYGLFVPKAIR